MKTCFKCDVSKPLADFYSHPRMADGHLNKCKACTKKDVRTNRKTKLESYRQYDVERAAQPHRMAQARRSVAAWIQRSKDRHAAQIALRIAVRAGRVNRWPVCEVPTCNRKPHAHHPHYGMPLVVVWLCPDHHKQAHAITDERN